MFQTFNCKLGVTIEDEALKNHGIGVGLTTASTLCNALGGEVFIKSE